MNTDRETAPMNHPEPNTAAHLRAMRDQHPEGTPEWLAYQGALEAVDPMERAERRKALGHQTPSRAAAAAQAVTEANNQMGRGNTIAGTASNGDTVAAPDPVETAIAVDDYARTRDLEAAGMVADPVTGEAHRVDILAADIAHLEREAQALRARLDQIEEALTPKRYLFRLAGVTAHEAPGGARVTVVPGRPGAQRVNRRAAQQFADALMRVGVGRMEWTATADELRKRAAEVIAAGIPYQQILPDPQPGQPSVVVVWPDPEAQP